MPTERCLTEDYEFRGHTYHLWTDGRNRWLVDPTNQQDLSPDIDFVPPLTNGERLRIDKYGRD